MCELPCCIEQVYIQEDEDQNIHFKNLSVHRAATEEEALNLVSHAWRNTQPTTHRTGPAYLVYSPPCSPPRQSMMSAARAATALDSLSIWERYAFAHLLAIVSLAYGRATGVSTAVASAGWRRQTLSAARCCAEL